MTQLRIDTSQGIAIVTAKNLGLIIRAWSAVAEQGAELSCMGKPIPIPFPISEKVHRVFKVVANGTGGHSIRPLN